jgi:hypothetical protein
MLKLAIAVITVLLSSAAIAQEPQPTAPKPSGHYLPKPGATAEDFRRDVAGCQMRAEIAAPLGPIANWEANMAAVASQQRIIATCMRANGWIWTTEASPTTTPPPGAKTPPAAAAAPKSKSTPASAQIQAFPPERYSVRTPEASALQKVVNARPADDSTNDPAWRASLADALHRYCESVLVQVPRNTSEEDHWVDSEWHDVSQEHIEGDLNWKVWSERMQRLSERTNQVQNSVPNARKELRHVLSECSSLTKNLIELKQTAPVAEALLWVRLSEPFAGREFVLRPAEILGLISPKYCNDQEQHLEDLVLLKWAPPPGAHDENDICLWDSVHVYIITHAVIPLLEGSGAQ